MVEFNASLIGLHFALEARFHDVVLEGDNLMVIASLSNRQIELVNASVIVADTLDLSNLCSSCSFSFVKRCGNFVADTLTKFTLSLDDNLIWLEDPLFQLENALLFDVLSLL